MDRGAWQAIVHGVAKSQTRLKQLSLHACVCDGHQGRTSAMEPLTQPLAQGIPSQGGWKANQVTLISVC